MSFFERQDRARRNTLLLVAYFVAAVVCIILAVNAALYLFFGILGQQRMTFLAWLGSPFSAGVILLTLAVIAGGSLFRTLQLGKGGLSVALMAGAVPVVTDTRNAQERVLLNVVEEMAIASGCAVPRVFVMREEQGINAFVAGTQPHNTILAVTQGALDKLTRDELQGVVGHEFSHILNGDMALNLRLIGILAGILVIGQIGEFLLRGEQYRSLTSRRDKNNVWPLALLLVVIGYVGLFFGRLIKAAISRQRELLADASSVQFTRNPEGIASALYAIQFYSGHGYLNGRHAEEMSHMCFGDTVKIQLSSLLATHPSIEQRIRAIDPSLLTRLKYQFARRLKADPSQVEVHHHTDHTLSNTPTPLQPETRTTAKAPLSPEALASGLVSAVSAAAIKKSVGTPTPSHYQYARHLHQHLPDHLKQAAHNPHLAAATLYGLLLTEARTPEVERILEHNRPWQQFSEAVSESGEYGPKLLKSLPAEQRLPLLEIALATLKSSAGKTSEHILETCMDLIKGDKRITFTEFVYGFLIKQELHPPEKRGRQITSLESVQEELAVVIATLAKSSQCPEAQIESGFRQIMGYFSHEDFSHWLSKPMSPSRLETALFRLGLLSPLLKQPVIDALVDCVLLDDRVTIRERELLRAVCAALGCPMPPILNA